MPPRTVGTFRSRTDAHTHGGMWNSAPSPRSPTSTTGWSPARPLAQRWRLPRRWYRALADGHARPAAPERRPHGRQRPDPRAAHRRRRARRRPGRDRLAPLGRPPVGHPPARRRPGRRHAHRADPPGDAGGVVVHRPRDHKDLSPGAAQQHPRRPTSCASCATSAPSIRPPSPAPSATSSRTASRHRRPCARPSDVHARRGRHGVAGAARRPRRVGHRRQARRQRARDGDGPADRRSRAAAGRVPRRRRRLRGRLPRRRHVRRARVRRLGRSTPRRAVQQARDTVRDGELVAVGVVPIRFTYRQITKQAAAQADRIRRVLRRWAPHVLGGFRPTG